MLRYTEEHVWLKQDGDEVVRYAEAAAHCDRSRDRSLDSSVAEQAERSRIGHRQVHE